MARRCGEPDMMGSSAMQRSTWRIAVDPIRNRSKVRYGDFRRLGCRSVEENRTESRFLCALDVVQRIVANMEDLARGQSKPAQRYGEKFGVGLLNAFLQRCDDVLEPLMKAMGSQDSVKRVVPIAKYSESQIAIGKGIEARPYIVEQLEICIGRMVEESVRHLYDGLNPLDSGANFRQPVLGELSPPLDAELCISRSIDDSVLIPSKEDQPLICRTG